MNQDTKALLASAGVLVVTVIHHFYAAAIFDTPWRRHVAVIVVPVLAVMLALYAVQRWRPLSTAGRGSLWLFAIVAAVVPIAWIGFFDGGYTHVVKNILVLGGASDATLSRLIPAHEMTTDFVYESTGVLQFVLALAAAYYLTGMLRAGRRSLPAG